MFYYKRRVEEDLARIRTANLPEDVRLQEEAERLEHTARLKAATKKDGLAMVIAALSLILPYAAVFMAVLGVLVWLMTRWA